MSTEKGYGNKKKYGMPEHKTIHNLGGETFGPMVVAKVLRPSGVQVALTDVEISRDSTRIRLEAVAHGCAVGDIIRFIDGALSPYDSEVIDVLDNDNIVIYNTFGVPTIGDTIEGQRYITPRTDDSGNLVVSDAPIGPVGTKFGDIDISGVTELAYTEVVATVGATAVKKVQIFMSNGQRMYLAFGAAAAEVDQIIVPPGGNGYIDLSIPANTRLSVKRVDPPDADPSVNAGRFIINLLG